MGESKQFKNAVEFCRKYDRIIVTASQRSGTTICGKMLAFSLGWKYIDESGMPFKDKKVFLAKLIKGNKIVVQSPGFRVGIHNFIPEINKYKVGVILIKRDVKEIELSRKRIKWGDGGFADINNPLVKEVLDSGLVKVPEGKISEMQFRVLQVDYLAKKYPLFTFLINYHDLEGHSLWIPKEKRLKFKPKQTK